MRGVRCEIDLTRAPPCLGWMNSWPAPRCNTEEYTGRCLRSRPFYRLWLLSRNDLADELSLFGLVQDAIGAKDFVEPFLGLAINIRMLPRTPGEERLRFSGDKAPVDGGDFVFFCDGKNALKGAALGPGHVFGTQDGPVIFLQFFKVLQKVGGLAVIVEGENVGLLELDLLDGVEFFEGSPVPVPEAAGEGLRGTDFASPSEGLRKYGADEVALVGQFLLFVAAFVHAARLIPHVPTENALIVGKGADDSFHVAFEARKLRGIFQRGGTGALYPP